MFHIFRTQIRLKNAYYFVIKGRKPGIYDDHFKYQLQISGYSKSISRKFTSINLGIKYFSEGNKMNLGKSFCVKRLPLYVNGKTISQKLVDPVKSFYFQSQNWKSIKEEKTIVYTDGSIRGSRLGIGAFFLDGRQISHGWCGNGNPTSEEAEWLAVAATLDTIGNSGHVVIYTDLFSIISFFSSPKPLKIKPYQQFVYERLNKFSGTVEFNYVKGHSNIKGNNEAHRLARLGAEQSLFQAYFNTSKI